MYVYACACRRTDATLKCAEAETWAKYRRVVGEPGVHRREAVGPACEGCLVTGLEIMGFPDRPQFTKAFRSDTALRKVAMNIMEKLKAKPWDNTTRDLGNVYVNKGQVLENPETVDLYTEAELRQVLGVTRLPKRAVHNVPCAAIPSREDPSQYTTVYAFRQKEDNVIPRV